MKKLFAVLLAVLILSAIAVPVFAADSPSGDGKYKIDIYYHLDTTEHKPTIEVKDGDTYVFELEDHPDYEFDRIEIICKSFTKTYTTTDPIELKFDSNGDKDSLVLSEDVEIHIYYKDKTPVNPDPTPVSPPTGVNVLPYVAMIFAAIFGIAFAARKLVKNH